MVDYQPLLTVDVLRALRDSNPHEVITEHRIRAAIRAGRVATPRVISGCYFWTWNEVEKLAEVLGHKVPRRTEGAVAGGGS